MADTNPDARLTLTIDWPEITIERLSRVASLWANLVQSVSAEATGKRDAVRWVVTSITYASPLRVEASPEVVSKKLDPAIVGEISHAVIAGIAHLEKTPDSPEFFTPQALSVARKLAVLSDAEKFRRLIVSNGAAAPVALTQSVAATIDDIIGPVVESYGSIEGQLEGVMTHGKRRFYVYDALTRRQVRCFFDDTVPLRSVLDAYEKRVSVSGTIKAKALTGEPLSIAVVELHTFRPDSELLPTDEILRMWGHP
jgi:hypothetical protein